VAVHRTKSSRSSPTFEKINQERLRKCAETAKSVEKAIEESKKLTAASRQLIDNIHKHRKKAS